MPNILNYSIFPKKFLWQNEYDGFVQISVNIVKEKLQQFINDHRMVLVVVKQAAEWIMVDFGMDLAALSRMQHIKTHYKWMSL